MPRLSTIILNWNRADLLARTLESYARTVSVEHEVFIVDNGSTDDSPAVIKQFQARHPAEAILLSENRGGDALNEGIARATGDLIHLSENDLIYEPGWCETVLSLFDAFSTLGQLSVFGPTPRDNEVWEPKPSLLRHAKGRILYEDLGGNLGTASVLRRDLFDRGIRIGSYARERGFLCPDDIKLSADVKAAGYMIAWAPHYLVENIGHSPEEFDRREAYYITNYRAKPWLGEDGWRQRYAQWREKPKPIRETVLRATFPDDTISPEKTLPNPECLEPQLWSMFDGWTAEIETIEAIYGLVRLTKPRLAVETGTWHGATAAAIGQALRRNGRGRLVTMEIDPESFEVSCRRIERAGLTTTVTLLNQPSLSFEPDEAIDFLLLDSELALRPVEFRHFQPHLAPGALVIFHDTNAAHAVVRAGVEQLAREQLLSVLSLPTPRGVMICQYTGAAVEVLDISPLQTIVGANRFAGNLDAPNVGSPTRGAELAIFGWIIGMTADVNAIHVRADEADVQQIPVNFARPDVAAVFPEIAAAGDSGFSANVDLKPLHGEFTLHLVAELGDGSESTVWTIRGRRPG